MSWVAPTERDGLQAERTDLAWARTSLSFLVNGGLLLMLHRVHGPHWLMSSTAGLSALLLLFTLYMSRRRRQVLEKRPLPAYLADPVGLLLLGAGTAVLGLATLATLLIG